MGRTGFAAVVGLVLSISGGDARADCYDVFGCSERDRFRATDLRSGPTCEFLWTMRNSIYRQRGYCFATPRGVDTFGNEGCRYRDIARVPLNATERANAATILRVEREKGCSG